MKAAAFDYHPAASLADALSALALHGEGAKLLAGGQSLLSALNLRLSSPEVLIDLGAIPELKGIAPRADGGLRIGAMVRHTEVERSALVRDRAPLLADAAPFIAHPAIRNRGTLGGNLVYADPASEFPACLVALEAEVVLAGPDGERRVAAERFFTGIYETDIRDGEILVAVDVPPPGDGQSHAFLELSRRTGDYALVGVACRARLEGGVFRALRPVFFAAGPRPLVAAGAAAVLLGAAPDDEAALSRAADALAGDLEPQKDLQITVPVRLHLARTLLRRAVMALRADPALRAGAEGEAR